LLGSNVDLRNIPGTGRDAFSLYFEHARQCRELARTMVEPEHRDQLLVMADVWDQLARDRIDLTMRHPELRVDSDTRASDPA
jgi:hypothetical protein